LSFGAVSLHFNAQLQSVNKYLWWNELPSSTYIILSSF
jgi:hypothetical protein